eukprot:g5985.t1
MAALLLLRRAALTAPVARHVAAISAAPAHRRWLCSAGEKKDDDAAGSAGAAAPEVEVLLDGLGGEAGGDAASAASDNAGGPEPLSAGNVVDGAASETHGFQAETRQLLDIVTNSLYTDKEVFVRELVSNASDALEKLRHLQVTGLEIEQPELPLEIRLSRDEAANTLTIQDTGVGLSRQDMIDSLGTIARSGSKAFVQELAEKGGGSDAAEGIIGQFGVGFYSVFMVAKRVQVFSRSAKADAGEAAHCWSSDGSGSYDIVEAEGVDRGTTIVIELDDAHKEYTSQYRVESIIKKYSNFVNFPIVLDGAAVNTVTALWTKSKNEVTEAEYADFYKFIANAFDDPMFTLHFQADAPISLNTLFFVPAQHSEKYGMGRMEPGVNLYSRKVLIESKCKDVLPEWLRFVKGVVDSEDLPLSISREKPQDSRLLVRIREVLVRRLLRFFDQQLQKERSQYETFYAEHGQFLKEGVCTDFANKEGIAKLLLFESSALGNGELTSIDEYINRQKPTQEKVYYLLAPDRSMAEASPYFETFRKNGVEVLFMYTAIDDFVMNNLTQYNGRPLVSAESKDLEFGGDEDGADDEDGTDSAADDALVAWLKEALSERVREVKTTTRLVDSPAIITDHESAALRRMMQMVDTSAGAQAQQLPLQNLEVNPKHPLIQRLSQSRDAQPALAKLVAEQVLDNALVSAGLMDDSRVMLPRINELLEHALAGGEDGESGESGEDATTTD